MCTPQKGDGKHMSVKQHLVDLQKKMNANPEGIERLNSVYQFDLTGDVDEQYQVKFENGKAELIETTQLEPDCTLQLSGENLLKLLRGNFNTTMAFMTGKLKVKGDITLALKLQAALEKYS